jgi:hypothetical protein
MENNIEVVCKFLLCVLMTQLGKTFTAVGRISSEIKRDGDPGQGRSIHLVWTMNTLLNNSQFSNRLHSIEEEYGVGSVVIFASKYDGGRYKHVKNMNELSGICLDLHTCPRVIVMCSNDIRFDDGFRFINILNSNTTNISRVFAYYDELHKYINDKLRDQIEGIDKMDIVRGILALTATPQKILLKTGYWSSIQMIDLGVLNEENYSGCADMNFILEDDYFPPTYKRPSDFNFEQLENDVVGFVLHVLGKHPEILNEGSRTFIPAHKRRVGHQLIRTEIFKRCPNAVVVVLNGEEKNMKYRDTLHFRDMNGLTKVLNLVSTSEEVCQTISKRICENNLEGRPLVVTGFLCVGMGQTLIHETLGTFTSAILSHLDLTNDDIYQLFGRLTARSKKWGDKYVKTNVYCPTISMYRIIAMEECARRLATDYDGKMIREEDYNAPLLEMGLAGAAAIANMREKKEKKVKKIKAEIIEHPVAFTSLKEVDDLLTKIFKKPIQVRSFTHSDKTGGYTISTRLNAYYHKKKDELDSSNRLTKEFYNNIKLGMNISANKDSGQPYMVYPVYKTMESNASDFKYYVRYLRIPEEAIPENTLVRG